MKVLVLGSGGREHALIWKLSQDRSVTDLYCLPGNDAISAIAHAIPGNPVDPQVVLDATRAIQADLVVVGPEAPLFSGVTDALRAAGVDVFGPSREAAAIEGSKAFAKEFMARHRIPTARFGVFRELGPAVDFIRELGGRCVVKASGPALGKGVVVAEDEQAAVAAAEAMLVQGSFGEAGREVVVEERLEGEEVSFLVITDGERIVPLLAAQDHKRIGDRDTGPNTGGMGAITPVPWWTPALQTEVTERIITPALAGLKAEGRPYAGVLYAGLMITRDGPVVLEFNARFGDPETQPIMRLLDADLGQLLYQAATGHLEADEVSWYRGAAAGVVLAAGGYPGEYRRGDVIEGLDAAARVPGVTIFHAGTRREGDRWLTNGGRVLNVVARGRDLAAALEKAYQACGMIHWPGMQYRHDIGRRALSEGHGTGK